MKHEDAGTGRTGARLGRKEVATRLRVSVPTVRRLEARGELHAEVGAHGTHLYAASEVEVLAARRRTETRDEGEDAARAFALYQAGKGVRDAVVELGVTPEEARYLWAEWRTPLGAPAPRRPRTRVEEDAERGRLDAAADREIEVWEAQMREQGYALEAEWRRRDEERARRRPERVWPRRRVSRGWQ